MGLMFRDVSLARPAVVVQPGDAGRVLDRVARWITVLAVAVAALLGAGALGLALYGYAHDDQFYEGIVVAGVDLGGLTRDEAAVAIGERFERFAAEPMAIEAAGQTFVLTPGEAGARLDVDATVERSFAYGRDGSFWDRSGRWARAMVWGADVTPVVEIESGVLGAEVAAIATQVDREASDAYVAMDVEDPSLVPDVPGVRLDRNAAGSLLAARFARLDAAPLSFPTTVVPAAVPAGQLEGAVPGARAAVAAPLVVSSVEGSWSLAPDDLRDIVSVGEDGRVVVDRARVEAFVESVAATVDRPAVDADVRLNDDRSLTVAPGRYSATIDVGTTTDAAVAALLAGEHGVTVTIERRPPAITDADASAAIAEAEALIAAGVELTWSGQVASGSATMGRDDLIMALMIDPLPEGDEKFSIVLDPWLMAEVIGPIQAEIDVLAVDAKFRLVDGVVTLVAGAEDGQALDAEAAAAAIIEAVGSGEPTVELPVSPLDPRYTAKDRTKIAVPDLLGDSATYYGTSSDPRRQNVERAVELEDGWLIPPDGVFSYNEYIGRIDEANGFTTGFGIVADEGGEGVTTAPVIGGGVCQVSTTIFQAAFWAGLTIEERWQHPYWLPGYGQPPRGMKGLDAMINIEDDWAIDMKFRNSTENWIAVVMIANGENVIAQIMGTDPGWEVRVDEPVLTNVVLKDEKMYFTESPELPAGQEMQVETAAEGFDAEITRTVLKDGEVIDEYVLTSSFAPSRNTTLRGTGR